MVKSNNIFKFVFLVLFLFFLVLYMSQSFGYYEYNNRKTNTLTEESVKRFEQDIKDGKNIKASDYIKKDNDYNNKLSKFGLKLSNIVGSVFDGVMGFLFYEVDRTVNS